MAGQGRRPVARATPADRRGHHRSLPDGRSSDLRAVPDLYRGHGAGLQAFDDVTAASDEVEGDGVPAGEVTEGVAAVAATGCDGDADTGEVEVDFEAGFTAY
ncbi:hypothetical protein ACKI1J_11605 [Streptomyces scabiei]|uniref:hypothetical protein n=1 Tax=Streptomyces scabiei TaxID=1930 RepID=UPI0038F5DF8B